MTHLNDIVNAVRGEFGYQRGYATVIVTVLLGTEEEVKEATQDIREAYDQEELACMSARFIMEHWKGDSQ